MNYKYYRVAGNKQSVIRICGQILDWYSFSKREWCNTFGVDKHTDMPDFIKIYGLVEISKKEAFIELL